MQKISRRLVLGAGTLAALNRRVALAQTGPVRFGFVAPLSGTQQVAGKGWLTGVQIAAEQLTAAGGILGRPVEVVALDDKANANNTLAGVRELAGKGINFIYTGMFTPLALAVLPLTTELNFLMSSTAVSDPLTHEAFNPHFFRIGDNNFMRQRAIGRLMAQRHPEIANWGALMFDGVTHASGWGALTLGLRQYYPQLAGKPAHLDAPILAKTDATDYRNQIAALMAQPSEGIYLGLSGETEATFFTQAKPLGLLGKIKVFLDLAQDVDVGRNVGHNMPPEMWSTSFWYPPANKGNKLSDDLYDTYVKRTGDKLPGSIVGLGHSMVSVYAAAIQQAQSTETDKVMQAMAGITADTCRGRITIRREDHQALVDIVALRMGRDDSEAGWSVQEMVRTPGAEVADTPTPGVAVSYS